MQYAPKHIYDAIWLHTMTYYGFKHITLVKFTKMNDAILFSTITRTAQYVTVQHHIASYTFSSINTNVNTIKYDASTVMYYDI